MSAPTERIHTKQAIDPGNGDNAFNHPIGLSAFAYAGSFAETFKDEAKPVIID